MQTQFDFSGKAVVVTGASDAIGVAIATRFHQTTTHVIATGRHKDDVSSQGSQRPHRYNAIRDVMKGAADALPRSI